LSIFQGTLFSGGLRPTDKKSRKVENHCSRWRNK